MSQSLLQYAFHLLLATAASFAPTTDSATAMAMSAAVPRSAAIAPAPTASRHARRAARVSLMDPYYSFSRGRRAGTRG